MTLWIRVWCQKPPLCNWEPLLRTLHLRLKSRTRIVGLFPANWHQIHLWLWNRILIIAMLFFNQTCNLGSIELLIPQLDWGRILLLLRPARQIPTSIDYRVKHTWNIKFVFECFRKCLIRKPNLFIVKPITRLNNSIQEIFIWKSSNPTWSPPQCNSMERNILCTLLQHFGHDTSICEYQYIL